MLQQTLFSFDGYKCTITQLDLVACFQAFVQLSSTLHNKSLFLSWSENYLTKQLTFSSNALQFVSEENLLRSSGQKKINRRAEKIQKPDHLSGSIFVIIF